MPRDLLAGQPPPSPTGIVPEGVQNVGRGFNRGMADLIGMPGDILDSLGEFLPRLPTLYGSGPPPGMREGPAPGGSAGVRQVLETVLGEGAATPPPDSTMGRIGEVTGSNVAAAVPFYAAAKSGMAVKGLFQPMIETVRAAPIRAALADLGLSVTQAIVGKGGEEVGKSVGAPATGRFVGEVAGTAIPLAGVAIGKKLVQTVDDALALSHSARQEKAADALRAAMSHGDETTKQILTQEALAPDYGKPTTGELTGDPGLIATQRALARRSPQSAGRSQDVRTAQNVSLREGLAELDEPATTVAPATKFFKERVANAARQAAERITRAADDVQTRLRALGPDMMPDEIQPEARRILDTSMKASRVQERAVWKAAGEGHYDVRPVKERAAKLIAERAKTENPADTAAVIYQIAPDKVRESMPIGIFDEYGTMMTRETIAEKGLLNDIETIDNVLALRTRLLNSIRAENAAGRWNRARKLREVLDTLFDDIVPVGKQSAEAMERVDIARAYSRSFNDAYSRGPIGKLMGYDTTGDVRVPPEKTLERLLRPGTDGVLGIRAMRRAAKVAGTPEALVNKASEDYLKASFAASAIDPTGTFDPGRATSFVRNHADLLNEFPQLKVAMLDSVSAEYMAQSVDKTVRNRIIRMETQSIAARFTKGEPSMQAAAILSDDNPVRAARALMNGAAKDPSGTATKGVKAAFYEIMMDRVAPDVRADLDAANNPFVNARKLRNFIDRYGGAVREVYGEDGLALLREVSRGATINARIAQGVATGGGSDTAQNVAARMGQLVGSIGAIIGTKLNQAMSVVGGGTHGLMAAGMGRRVAVGIINRYLQSSPETVMLMLEDALYNPQMARDMIMAAHSPKAAVNVTRYEAFKNLSGVAAKGLAESTEGTER